MDRRTMGMGTWKQFCRTTGTASNGEMCRWLLVKEPYRNVYALLIRHWEMWLN